MIHANDSPRLAPLALNAARRYAQIAPAVPHALHMPSHIFTRMGLWDEDIAANVKSAGVARQYEVQEQGWHGLWDQRGHAMDYTVYAYLQKHRDSDAKKIVDEANAVTVSYPAGSYTNAYALAAIPARYALERNAWKEAAALTVRPAPDARWRPEAITHFARAIGAARSGDTCRCAGRRRRARRHRGGQGSRGQDSATGRIGVARTRRGRYGRRRSPVRRQRPISRIDEPSLPISPGPVLPARELSTATCYWPPAARVRPTMPTSECSTTRPIAREAWQARRGRLPFRHSSAMQ